MRNSNSKIYEIDRSNTFLYANESAQFSSEIFYFFLTFILISYT